MLFFDVSFFSKEDGNDVLVAHFPKVPKTELVGLFCYMADNFEIDHCREFHCTPVILTEEK